MSIDVLEARLSALERLLDERRQVQTSLDQKQDGLIKALTRDVSRFSVAWKIGVAVATLLGFTFYYLNDRVSGMKSEVDGVANEAGDAVKADIRTFGDDYLRGKGRELQPPTGTVIAYAAQVSTAAERKALLDAGWILCDGHEYSWISQPELESLGRLLVQVVPSKAEGTFRVPDYRGLFLRGLADADGPGGQDPAKWDDPTRALGSLQLDAIQRHGHTDAGHAHKQQEGFGNGGSVIAGEESQKMVHESAFSTVGGKADIRDPISIKDGPQIVIADETRPRNVAVNWLVKY